MAGKRGGALPAPLFVRFWSKIDASGDGCWIWTGAVNDWGYGVFWPGERTAAGSPRLVYAHRFSYELHLGPVPEGMEIDHRCFNRACVRPDHLEPVDHRTNTRRAAARRRERVA